MSLLYESIWAGYNILFEANAGDALHRGVNFLAGEYNIPRDQARTMCQAVRRACFDIFSDDASLADKTKDPKVKAVIGLFVPVLKFLCERFGIHDGNPASMRKAADFGERMLATAHTVGLHPGPNGTMLNNDGDALSFDDILSAATESQDSLPAKQYGGTSRYTVVPITSHTEATSYAGKLPFCLTWGSMQYWDQYTQNGKMKCYFILRDDYDTIHQPSDYNDDDDYARSAIALVVKPDGSIDSLFNRRNHVNKIYNEAQLSEFLQKPFRAACPPYTEKESNEAMERNAAEQSNGYIRPPVSCENVVDVINEEFSYMIDEELNPDGYLDVYYDGIIDDVVADSSVRAYLVSDYDYLQTITIRDATRGGKKYTAMAYIDIDYHYMKLLTDWVEGYGYWDDNTLFPCTSGDFTTRFPGADPTDTLFLFDRALYRFIGSDTRAEKIMELPEWADHVEGIVMQGAAYDKGMCYGLVVGSGDMSSPEPGAPYRGGNLILLRDTSELKPLFDHQVDMAVTLYLPTDRERLPRQVDPRSLDNAFGVLYVQYKDPSDPSGRVQDKVIPIAQLDTDDDFELGIDDTDA